VQYNIGGWVPKLGCDWIFDKSSERLQNTTMGHIYLRKPGRPTALYYQGLISVLRWICELGRMDILTEVSMLSSHNAMPRQGHQYAEMDIFLYLKSHQSAAIVFNNAVPNIDERRFKRVDWSDIYGNVKEALPPNMPTPLGFPVHTVKIVSTSLPWSALPPLYIFLRHSIVLIGHSRTKQFFLLQCTNCTGTTTMDG
jgi:hypothetical protein